MCLSVIQVYFDIEIDGKPEGDLPSLHRLYGHFRLSEVNGMRQHRTSALIF